MGYAALAVREVTDTRYGASSRRGGDAPHARAIVRVAQHSSQGRVVHEHSRPNAAVLPDPDVVEELGDEIATLSAHIHAATHRLLVLIAEFDRLHGWELAGYPNCARWLAARTGIDLGAAREKVRAARALKDLPHTGAAMARGELSFSQLRALTRVASSENECELLELARGTTTEQLERMVRAWKKGSRGDEAAADRERFASRTFSVFPDGDGMYVVRGRLTPEVGALLMRAIEAASDACYRERGVTSSSRSPVASGAASRPTPGPAIVPDREAARPPGLAGRPAANVASASVDSDREATQPPQVPSRPAPACRSATVDSDREAAQRRADALGLLAERALAAGFGAARDDDAPAAEAPISGTRAERYRVMLHVDRETLPAEGGLGRSELEDGTGISAETSRRIACDASVVTVTHEKDGSVLDVGRKTRTIPPALRRALEVRDRGCRFPGCGLRFCDAHHVRHWADGGETKLGNCLLLCKFHHTLVHERGWRVEWWGKGRPVFTDPRGAVHFDGRWKPVGPAGEPVGPAGEPVEALVSDNVRRGVEPDPWTASARWEREKEIPGHVYFAALEAL